MQKSIRRPRLLAAAMLVLGGVAAAPAQAAGAGPWQQISNPPPVLSGLDGKAHTAACSGYPGSDPRYSFWAKRGKSKNLVVYFEGGGACWNDTSCSFPLVSGDPAYPYPQFFIPQIPSGPETYDGIFNASHPANPVKDWSFVYIPYCTGDVHTGAADRVYNTVPNPYFSQVQVPAFQIRHRGHDNFMVVLDWISKNVDKPEKLLVAGSSAGGYGASANFPWVQKVFPRAQLSVLADASQGVLSQGFDTQNPGRNSWNPQLMPQVFGNDVNAVASASILNKAAASFPRARVAQFTTQLDLVQAQFHGAAAQFNPPGASCSNIAVSWNNQMLAALQTRTASVPNFRHYLAAGSFHTILRGPQMYSESSTGRPFTDWLAAMLDGDDQQAKRAPWNNQACPGCLQPIPCPAP